MHNDITQKSYYRTSRIDNTSRTHKGNVRSINEDSILCHELYPLYVIADGMGGHSAGDKASQFIVHELAQLRFDKGDLQYRIACIEQAITTINKDIFNASWVADPAAIVGSTLLVVYIENDICTCFWVGDSRLYIYRKQRLYQISRDHSLVQEMLDKGLISQDEADTHPQHNVLTRAIGVDKQVDIEINQFNILRGDKLLLCSDGLYNELEAKTLIADLSLATTEQIAERLLTDALAGTAADNLSFIVLQIK